MAAGVRAAGTGHRQEVAGTGRRRIISLRFNADAPAPRRSHQIHLRHVNTGWHEMKASANMRWARRARIQTIRRRRIRCAAAMKTRRCVSARMRRCRHALFSLAGIPAHAGRTCSERIVAVVDRGLPMSRAWVGVGPPLLASGPIAARWRSYRLVSVSSRCRSGCGCRRSSPRRCLILPLKCARMARDDRAFQSQLHLARHRAPALAGSGSIVHVFLVGGDRAVVDRGIPGKERRTVVMAEFPEIVLSMTVLRLCGLFA